MIRADPETSSPCGLAGDRGVGGGGGALQLSYDMERDQSAHQLLICKVAFKPSNRRGHLDKGSSNYYYFGTQGCPWS